MHIIINVLCLIIWAIVGLCELFFLKKTDKLTFGAMWLCLMLQLIGNLFE